MTNKKSGSSDEIRPETLTFAQREGAEPLPSQLQPKVISSEMRALLWRIIDESMEKSVRHPTVYGDGESHFRDPWLSVLKQKHHFRDHQLTDFVNNYEERRNEVRAIFQEGDYVAVLGFMEWLLQLDRCPISRVLVGDILELTRSAYQLVGERLIMPRSSDEERTTIERAFKDVGAAEFGGAREHLRLATEALTAGNSADSVRESIHAVESVARIIAGTGSLGDALRKLEAKAAIHPALKNGFSSIYGFTSDEKGIRHPLLDKPVAAVDDADALFMLGACAAFVSYLIARNR
jgi:hypothetical protein